jgi:hypothetical protein
MIIMMASTNQNAHAPTAFYLFASLSLSLSSGQFPFAYGQPTLVNYRPDQHNPAN